MWPAPINPSVFLWISYSSTCTSRRDELWDEHAAGAQVLCLPGVGFLDRERARRPPSTVQQFLVPIDLSFHAEIPVVAQLARELPAILLDHPERFAQPWLPRRGRVVGRVEGLVDHSLSSFCDAKSKSFSALNIAVRSKCTTRTSPDVSA